MDYLQASLWIMFLAFFQNVAFTLTSRSRNRDNTTYHVIAAVGSNGIWFLCMRQLILSDMSLALAFPYIGATVAGSVFGMKISMWIEKKLGATADGHITKPDSKKLWKEAFKTPPSPQGPGPEIFVPQTKPDIKGKE